MSAEDRQQPPTFCQYAEGECDQSFADQASASGIFLYPSDPPQIAETLETAVEKLKTSRQNEHWLTWRDFHTTGQIIFCAICKSCRFAEVVVADVTTLNFNVMFEIGFALGLGLPVIPVRDTTFERDRKSFDQLGLLDVIGYIDFQNADGLVEALNGRLPVKPIPMPAVQQNLQAPIFALKAPISIEGEIKLMSALKASVLNFKAYDPLESSRLSLQEARKAVGECFALVGHLLSPDRVGSKAHNARCALVAGIAVASGRGALLLQEGHVPQPIDYRQIVKSYERPSEIPQKLEPILRQTIPQWKDGWSLPQTLPSGLLERLDLGDIAAENESRQLRSYFVRTGQFVQAKRGHARLVIGRKGSGKTAIFYALRDSFIKGRGNLVLDLKPEGHQFLKLRETVLDALSPGMRMHTLTAFWNYILLCEVAQKVSDYDYSWAENDPERYRCFRALLDEYQRCGPADAGDMSERLLIQVDRLVERFERADRSARAGAFTEALFKDEIHALSSVVAKYLEHKEEVWILVDNLDKAWPTGGASEVDILIVRTLLDATRKLQRELAANDVTIKSLVFLRNDIYDHLVRETSDKGKDTAITLDWDDPEVFKDIVARRITSTTGIEGDFDDVWGALFDRHVGTRPAFAFVLERSLMRPRELLAFLNRAVGTAINRGHARVTDGDMLKAEENHSNELLQSLVFELANINEDYEEVLYSFLNCPACMSEADLSKRLVNAGLWPAEGKRLTELLLWFGFIGVQAPDSEPLFAYHVNYDLRKLSAALQMNGASFAVNPAFRTSLGCSTPDGQAPLPIS
jgi:hypothetical protein